jgi:hypothetical protein
MPRDRPLTVGACLALAAALAPAQTVKYGTEPGQPAAGRSYSSVSSGGSKLSNNSGFLANFFSTRTISPVRNPARSNRR